MKKHRADRMVSVYGVFGGQFCIGDSQKNMLLVAGLILFLPGHSEKAFAQLRKEYGKFEKNMAFT